MIRASTTTLARPSAVKAVLWSLGLHLGSIVTVLALEAWLADALAPAKFGGQRIVIHATPPTVTETAAEKAFETAVVEIAPSPGEQSNQVDAAHTDPAPHQAAAVAVRSTSAFRRHTVAKVAVESFVATEAFNNQADGSHPAPMRRSSNTDSRPETSPDGEAKTPSRRQIAHRPVSSTATVAQLPQVAGTDDETPPDFSGNRKPKYPREAYLGGIEGRVLLRLHVTATGDVEQVDVVRSSGYALLDRAAVEAVSSWRGTPARRGDRPVATRQLLPVRFQLR